MTRLNGVDAQRPDVGGGARRARAAASASTTTSSASIPTSAPTTASCRARVTCSRAWRTDSRWYGKPGARLRALQRVRDGQCALAVRRLLLGAKSLLEDHASSADADDDARRMECWHVATHLDVRVRSVGLRKSVSRADGDRRRADPVHAIGSDRDADERIQFVRRHSSRNSLLPWVRRSAPTWTSSRRRA